MPVLPDVLQSDLKLVFCGTAASTVSAHMGAYYANPTNAFWRTLHEIGLIPIRIHPQNFRDLLTYRIGLTDMAKHATGNDADLGPEDFDALALREKLVRYRPSLLAFTSKRAASAFFDVPTRKLNYGQQPCTDLQTRFWVLPSPSGAARSYWDVRIWQALADAVGTLSDT
ncbi:MAG: mismatch-specific DNA-glycosylase [Anaerolineae bacterium]